jgi:hypothetical protein
MIRTGAGRGSARECVDDGVEPDTEIVKPWGSMNLRRSTGTAR